MGYASSRLPARKKRSDGRGRGWEMTLLSQPAQAALLTILYVAGPILGVILAIGVIVGVFLAMTQINEPTISFVPKFLGTGLALTLLGPWLLRQIEAFTIAVLTDLPRVLQ